MIRFALFDMRKPQKFEFSRPQTLCSIAIPVAGMKLAGLSLTRHNFQQLPIPPYQYQQMNSQQ